MEDPDSLGDRLQPVPHGAARRTGFCSPCNRRLEEFVKNAPDQPEHMVEYCGGILPHTGG